MDRCRVLRFIFLCLFLLSPVARAEDDEALTLDDDPSPPKAIVIGHNVTPSTETLLAGVWTAGNYAVAVGLTDHLFVATSPWIWLSYNTANVHLKWAHEIDEQSRAAVFVSYFDSYNSVPLLTESTGSTVVSAPGRTPPSRPLSTTVHTQAGPPLPIAQPTTSLTFQGLNRYQWENVAVHALYSHRFDSFATVYLNLMYSYFWNDDLAYSIRMDPGSDAIRGQVDATSLTVFPLGESGFQIGLEFGVLGANYQAPYMQLGLSMSYLSDSFLIQLGASDTVQFREISQQSGWVPGRYDSREHISQSAGESYYYRYLQTALHPEVQLQYFY